MYELKLIKSIAILVLMVNIGFRAAGQTGLPKKLFVIDSIPQIETSEDEEINGEAIAAIYSVTGLADRYPGLVSDEDSVVYIFTKQYLLRSDSIKQIPSTKLMVMREGKWHFRGSMYSGPFIDYYLDGTKQQDGTIHEGAINGQLTLYYTNGSLAKTLSYNHGVLNGYSNTYSKGGKLIVVSKYEAGVPIGSEYTRWHHNGHPMTERRKGTQSGIDTVYTYFSTGRIQQMNLVKNEIFIIDRRTRKINEAMPYVQQSIHQARYKQALRYCAQILTLDSININAYFYQGIALLNDNHPAWAIESFTKLLSLEPLYRPAMVFRAKAMIALQQKNNTLSNAAAICADLKLAEDLETIHPDGHKKFIKYALQQYCSANEHHTN